MPQVAHGNSFSLPLMLITSGSDPSIRSGRSPINLQLFMDRLHKDGKMAEEECEIKIAVVGESGVGKSCIVSSFCTNEEGETTEGQLINI